MKLEQQLCSLELSKRLKELRVKQESLWWWTKGVHWSREIIHEVDWHIETQGYGKEAISAFTVAELGEMLPKGYCSIRHKKCWAVGTAEISWFKKISPLQMADTEADARAKMLVYLLEKGLQ